MRSALEFALERMERTREGGRHQQVGSKVTRSWASDRSDRSEGARRSTAAGSCPSRTTGVNSTIAAPEERARCNDARQRYQQGDRPEPEHSSRSKRAIDASGSAPSDGARSSRDRCAAEVEHRVRRARSSRVGVDDLADDVPTILIAAKQNNLSRRNSARRRPCAARSSRVDSSPPQTNSDSAPPPRHHSATSAAVAATTPVSQPFLGELDLDHNGTEANVDQRRNNKHRTIRLLEPRIGSSAARCDRRGGVVVDSDKFGRGGCPNAASPPAT